MEGARVSGGSPGGERSEPEGEPLAPKSRPGIAANPERSGGEIETASMRYFNGFRARMVQRLATPCGPSAGQLAQEVGVSQPALSRWLREASSLGESSLSSQSPSPRKGMNGIRPQDWSATADARRVRELERELTRKEKALAEIR